MPAKAPDADLENAIKAYVAGESAEVVSARFHTGQKRLCEVLKERGLFRDALARARIKSEKSSLIERAKRNLPDEEIAQRYVAGESEAALAKAYGVSRSAIATSLRIAGVERRSSAEVNRALAAARTPEERARNAAAAHAAVRGMVRTWEDLCRRAQGRERTQSFVAPAERQLGAWLAERGLAMTPQLAIGAYNADLALHPVAVEIFGGAWHTSGRHAARASKRNRYILDQGWSLVFVWVDPSRWPLTTGAADYIATFYQLASSDPALHGQYRVIWGNGDEVAPGSFYFDEGTGMPALRAGDRA